MGCSASRPESFHNRTNPEDPSFSNYSSPYTSSPVPRALSLPTPLIHHPPLRRGDTHHLVSLTSTTYGSFLTDPKNPSLSFQHRSPSPPRVSKTPNRSDPKDSLSPDSVINTWELMDGLDDFIIDGGATANVKAASFDHPVISIESPKKPNSFRYMGNDGSAKKLLGAFVPADDSPALSKPLWQHLSEEALLAKMDPSVAASYRRALSSRQLSYEHSKTAKPPSPPSKPDSSCLPTKETKIVLYFTSLRGIRKTYEDCCSVRMIFRGFRVPVDERDVSMDSAFRKELQDLLEGKAMSLPQVFIGGKHIGGADEMRQLNEVGELTKLLEGFPVRDPGFVCNACGDARFVPCPTCRGSRKIFQEEEGQLRRCQDCNENGLIRCPDCCSRI